MFGLDRSSTTTRHVFRDLIMLALAGFVVWSS